MQNLSYAVTEYMTNINFKWWMS